MDVTITPSELGPYLRIVRPLGEIDSLSADVLDERILKAMEDGATHLVLDLSAVTYLNSAGVGVVAMAAKRTRAVGGDVVLVGLQDRPRRAIELVRLDQVLAIEGDVAGAIERLSAPRDTG